ncbi:MAG: fibronectin type III domain-containing protein [Prevotellaceae bacterium]|nr:fibronectin type III domain-containing protein [Prevotellaceae bacterium]
MKKLIILFCATLLAGVTVKAQTTLPVTVNQSSGNLSSYAWITLSNSHATWENGYGYQLNQYDGSMVFNFCGIPQNFSTTIHRYRTVATCFNYYPKVYVEASPDNATWRQVGYIDDTAPSDATYNRDDNVSGNLLPTDKYLRLRHANADGGNCVVSTSGYAYLVSLQINKLNVIANAATSITQNSFTANWQTVSGCTYQFYVYDENHTVVAGYNGIAVAAGTTSYNVTGLSAGKTYYYKIKAVLDACNSDFSNEITVKTTFKISVNYNNTSGTFTMTQYCFMQNLTAELWGAGGGGGGAKASASGTAVGGGGGGGGFISANFGNPTENISIQVGSGGTAGSGSSAGGGAGNNDTNHSKVILGSKNAIAQGGYGGQGKEKNIAASIENSRGNFGPGGGYSSANVTVISNVTGTAGSYGFFEYASLVNNGVGGAGGAGANGGGAGGTGVRNGDGNQGNTAGGGGAGGGLYKSGGSANRSGGAGANGNVIITFDFEINDISISNNKSLTFCTGDDVTLTASTCADANTTYVWYKAGESAAVGSGSSYIATTSGEYFVVATLTYAKTAFQALTGSGSATLLCNGAAFPDNVSTSKTSEIITVTVYPSPSVSTQTLSICKGGSIDITPNSDYTYSYGSVTDADNITLTDVQTSQTLSVTPKNRVTDCVGSSFNVEITIKEPSEETVFSASICAGELYSENGFNESVSGIYHQNLQNSVECDSIVTLHLTVNEPTLVNIDTLICEGEFYIDSIYNVDTRGQHKDTIYNAAGCDSIIFTLNLTIPLAVQGFHIETNIEDGTAMLTWTEDADAEKYVVEWFINGYDVAEGREEIVGETSYTITGLNFEDNAYLFSIYSDYECDCDPSKVHLATLIGGIITHFDEMLFEKVDIWTSNGLLYITNNHTKNSAVTIFSVIGKPVATLKILAGETRSLSLPQGIYLLTSGNRAVKVVL